MRVLAFTRATLQGTTWISAEGIRDLARRDRLWALPLAGLGILVGLGVLLFMIVGVYRSLLATGLAIGRPELLLFYSLLGSWAFLFVTAIPLSLSLLYYSKDLSLLLTLPIRLRSIVAAKALTLYLYCMPVNIVLVVPALWLYFAAVPPSAASIAGAILHLFVSPAFPLALSTLGVLGLSKAVNLSRFRVALEVAGMALGVALLVGLQVFLSRSTMANVAGARSIADFGGLYSSLSRAVPPIAWGAGGFASEPSLLQLLLSLGLTAASSAVALALAPINLTRNVMERRESGGERRRARGAETNAWMARRLAPRAPLRRLVGREWAILSSNSTFIFEAVGELLVLPLLLAVYGLILPKAIISQAMGFVASSPLMGLILMGVLILMTSLTTVSATSVSREGRTIALSLLMPLPGRRQVQAKLLLHLLLFGSAYGVDLAIVWVLFHFNLAWIGYMLPGGIAFQIVGFTTSLTMDLKRPILKWTHPQQAMKNNLNAVGGIGGTLGIVAIVAIPCALLALKGVNPVLLGYGAAVVGAVLAAVLFPRLMKLADRRYAGDLQMD